MSSSIVVDDPVKLSDLLSDTNIDVTGMDQLNEEAILVTTVPKQEAIVENASSNIVCY